MNIKEEKIDNYVLRTFYDDCGYDPREDDNLTKMVCFHKRYNLGDDHDIRFDDFDSWDDMEKYITGTEKPLIIKPLYLYDHSGITISTSPFGCSWDSGRIGFVYVRKEDVRNNFMIKNCGQRITERVNVLLEGEVEVYDKYLRGEVYGYEIAKINDNGQEEGLERYGGYFDEEQCIHDGRVSMEWFVNNEQVV